MGHLSNLQTFLAIEQDFSCEQSQNLGEFLDNFKNTFESEQTQHWLHHWTAHGDKIRLRKWNAKYSDYLEEGKTASAKSEETKYEDEAQEQAPEETTPSWQELWHQHSETVYLEEYNNYTTVFNAYYWHLKKAIEDKASFENGTTDDETDASAKEYDNMAEQMEQLQLLGLPSAFGGRPQRSGKRKKPSTRNNEGESDSSASDKSNHNEAAVDGDDALQYVDELTIAKALIQKRNKKRNRMLRRAPAFIQEDRGLLKYWIRRFSLFSRFDEGIQLDRESWFSVTPEKVAVHLAERLACDVVVDGFCGCGGNTIQFALTCRKVIAIDIDARKVAMAQHNARIYGVADRIEFIVGDFLQLSRSGRLHGDVVFLSPPWGGPGYKRQKQFDIEESLLPVGATELVECARNVSVNMALFLPRNADLKQMIRLAGVGNRCEVEHNYLDTRLVALTALYGEQILTAKS